MLKKIQLPLSIILLIAMIMVWKNVLDRFFPGLSSSTSVTGITAVKVRGVVTAEIGEKSIIVKEGQIIEPPVTITTAPSSLVILGYGPDFASKIKIGPNSKLDLSNFKVRGVFAPQGLNIDFSKGRMLLKIFNPSKQKVLTIQTPTISMGIRGTTFAVETFDDQSILLVKEGVVEVKTKDGKPQMAKTGMGFISRGENDMQSVQISDYNIDWNIDSTTSLPPPTSTTKEVPSKFAVDIKQMNIPLVIETEIRKMQNHVEDFPARLQRLKDQEKQYEDELTNISQDETCFQNQFANCEFTSEAFKNHPSNLKNNPSHLSLNAKTKASLEKEFAKEKEDAAQKKNNAREETLLAENDFQLKKEKLKNAMEKFEQYKTADEATKKILLKDIGDLTDSEILREAAKGE